MAWPHLSVLLCVCVRGLSTRLRARVPTPWFPCLPQLWREDLWQGMFASFRGVRFTAPREQAHHLALDERHPEHHTQAVAELFLAARAACVIISHSVGVLCATVLIRAASTSLCSLPKVWEDQVEV